MRIHFNFLFFIFLFCLVFSSSVFAVSSINYDLPNFCDIDVDEEYTVAFDDYMSLDYSQVLGVCYMSRCKYQGSVATKEITSPICFTNGQGMLGVFDWNSYMNYDVLTLDTLGVPEGTSCLATFGLAECDPDVDPDGCTNVRFDDGGWSWLPSDRYNDKMNIHMVLEMNVGEDFYDIFAPDLWGDITGEWCSYSAPPPGEDDTTTLDNNVFAAWNFDVDARESTGLDVTVHGSPTFNSTGILGHAYLGDGNDFISSSGYPLVYNHNWSYNFWAKGTSARGTILASKDPTATYGDIEVYVGTDDLFHFKTGYTTLNAVNITDTWHMHTIVLTNGHYAYFYDGVSVFNSSTTNNVDFSTDLIIGADWYGDDAFDGYLDEMIFYGRSLSGSEVSDLYNSGSALSFDGDEFSTTPPNYEISISNTHHGRTFGFNESYCFDLDYYFDNADYYEVWYNDLPTSIGDWSYENSLSEGYGSLNADYWDVSLGANVGRPSSEVCIDTYERNTNFTIEVVGYDLDSNLDSFDIDFIVEDNYTSSIKTYHPFLYRYVLDPDDPTDIFSFNYFYGNYDDVEITFDDGGNTTLSCGIGDDVTHNYTGNISVDLVCDDMNVWLYLGSLNNSWSGVFYTNVSNSVMNITDYFNLSVFTGAPTILHLHNDTAMAYYSVYTDDPGYYFGDYDSIDVVFRIPGTNNYRIISKGDDLVNYSYYNYEYQSDGDLVVASKNIDWYSCVFYVAKNSYGESKVSYLNTITRQGITMEEWDCDQVWNIIDNDLDFDDLDSYDSYSRNGGWFERNILSFIDIVDITADYSVLMKIFWTIVVVFTVGMYMIFGKVKITLVFGAVFVVGVLAIMAFFAYSTIGIISPKLVVYTVVGVLTLLVALYFRGGGN